VAIEGGSRAIPGLGTQLQESQLMWGGCPQGCVPGSWQSPVVGTLSSRGQGCAVPSWHGTSGGMAMEAIPVCPVIVWESQHHPPSHHR